MGHRNGFQLMGTHFWVLLANFRVFPVWVSLPQIAMEIETPVVQRQISRQISELSSNHKKKLILIASVIALVLIKLIEYYTKVDEPNQRKRYL